ncbi:MAG: ATP-dependent Clp protease adaptor ClpS [Chitinophagaceae bacterium]|jgi:ATP-dependent Clp protease adaptor protein ClpS
MKAYQGENEFQSENQEDLLTATHDPCQLIVWNDEVNTFEWVITTLMEICGHSHEQAEQCAYIIHFKGKYAVKQGDFDQLKAMCEAITNRGINATVEISAS